MFCNRYGTTLQLDYNLCPKCGSPVSGPARATDPARFARHLRTLGILWIAVSAFWILPSIGLLTVGHAFHLFAGNSEPFARIFVPPVMFGLGAGFLVLAAAGICIGWGLKQHEPWARGAAIVLGIIVLIHPPFGTLLGVYTLWVLFSNDAAAYERAAQVRCSHWRAREFRGLLPLHPGCAFIMSLCDTSESATRTQSSHP